MSPELARSPPQGLGDLYRLSDPALSELPLEALLDELLTRVREILGVDTVAVLLRERDELVARAAKGLEAEVEQGVRIPLGAGFAGRIAAERHPIFIPDVAEADVVNPILREIGIVSLLGVPLISEARLLGVMHIGSLTPREFTIADAALLDLVAGRVAPAIERARLFETLEQERLAAVTLQRGLLQESLPDVPNVGLAVRYVPSRGEVGGDWYDVIELPGGMVAATIGDVVGHGVRAAALMAQLRAATRAYALADPSPASVLTRLDRYVQHSHPQGMATVAYVLLDPLTGQLRCCAAGHPPPLVTGPAADTARFVELPPAPPVGVRAFAAYHETELQLEVDETLLLYTDGLIERRGEPLDAGLQRLRDAAAGETQPEWLCSRVITALMGAASADDDVALVAMARTRPAEDLRMTLPAERSSLAPMRQRVAAWMHAHGADRREANAVVLATAEAAANAIEHAYPPGPATFTVEAFASIDTVEVQVRDTGCWREGHSNPLRGRGLQIMRATMDHVEVASTSAGTVVTMRRRLGA